MALVTSSGPLGLSAFFPPATASSKTQGLQTGEQPPTFLPPPHLPLTPTWQEADFSLASVLKTTTMPGEDVGLRAFCMRLLSRYLYLSGELLLPHTRRRVDDVAGRSTSHFHMAKSPEHIRRVIKSIDADPNISILGINDDIEADYETTRMLMNQWFEKRWPEKAAWEH
jgi:3-O-alpha-D-mannopyranosyl-alpha-D-mannopyranose xylosylphosphotransferase